MVSIKTNIFCLYFLLVIKKTLLSQCSLMLLCGLTPSLFSSHHPPPLDEGKLRKQSITSFENKQRVSDGGRSLIKFDNLASGPYQGCGPCQGHRLAKGAKLGKRKNFTYF